MKRLSVPLWESNTANEREMNALSLSLLRNVGAVRVSNSSESTRCTRSDLNEVAASRAKHCRVNSSTIESTLSFVPFIQES